MHLAGSPETIVVGVRLTPDIKLRPATNARFSSSWNPRMMACSTIQLCGLISTDSGSILSERGAASFTLGMCRHSLQSSLDLRAWVSAPGPEAGVSRRARLGSTSQASFVTSRRTAPSLAVGALRFSLPFLRQYVVARANLHTPSG